MGVAGSIETKAISATNLKLKLKLTEVELGKSDEMCVDCPPLNVKKVRTYCSQGKRGILKFMNKSN